MIEEEETIEGEMPLMIVKKVIVHKRDQESQDMKTMLLLLNLNIFLFFPFLIPLQILVIVR